jgi:hypothetical protein
VAKQQIDLPKWREVQERDYAQLEAFRVKHATHIAEYLGSNYGTGGIENPINVLSQFVNTVVRQLVGSDPRALISTFNRTLRAFAEAAQDDENRRLKKMRYDEILANSVVDAMFLMGIRYRAITAPIESRLGYYRVPGEVGICNIAFEDWCCDTSVSCIEDGEYQMHFFDAHYEDVKNCKLFSGAKRKDLQPSEPTMFNPGGSRKLRTINMSASNGFDRYEDYIRMGQVYFPRYKLVMTYAVDHDFDEPLLEQDWVGPECGPYEYLMLQRKVSGKAICKSPIMDLVDTARSINHHAKHIDNQASQQKSILGFMDEDDAREVNNAEQGRAVHLKNPQGIVPISLFGVDQPLAIHLQQQRELFNEQSGTRALGGMSASAKTATQEKMVAASASELIQSWGQMVTKSAERDMDALGWFFWNNPHQKLESTYQLPGMPDVSADRSVTPEERSVVPWSDMQLQIDAFSLTHVPPGQRAQIIDEMVRNVLIPMAPMFAQPGVGQMLEKYINFKAKYHNMPELNELAEPLIGAQGEPTAQPAEGAEEPMQPPGQETVHTRVSQPGMTEKGNQQVLSQLMAGGKQQSGAGAKGLGQMAVA